MFGIVNLHKGPGVSSRHAVNAVQRLARRIKIGHAGTLDPLATGVLVVCLGKATRLIEWIQRSPKSYRGEFLLGRSSETEDIEGPVLEFPDCPRPAAADLERLLPRFVGVISQRPPAYSAVKIGGQRAYALARRGTEVQPAPREVAIHDLRIAAYDYPRLTLDIRCGSGVYVRSLGRDLAAAAGTHAVMSGLVRTAVGPFRLEDAVTVEQLQQDGLPRWLAPPAEAVRDLPQVVLTPAETEQLKHAVMLPDRWNLAGEEIVGVDQAGDLVAIFKRKGGLLRPARNFVGQ